MILWRAKHDELACALVEEKNTIQIQECIIPTAVMMETILAVPITVIRMMTPIMQPKTIVIQILIQMTQTVLLVIQVHHPAVIDALGTLKSTVIDVLG